MPAYNAELTISNSIESVLNQTFIDFKLYIVNDCSTDDTLKIISKFDDKRIIILNNEKNEGVAFSRNKAISKAKGKYIAFLDSDDLWLPNKLMAQLDKLENGYDIVCSNYIPFRGDFIEKIRMSPEIITKNDMMKSNLIGNLTGVYNCNTIGKVYQKPIGHEDYIMWLEIINKANTAYCIQEPLAKYRLSSNSLSGNKLKAMQWQWVIYRNELKMPLLKAIYYFSHYILNALKKRR
ncbi:glycosyltransferase family 2 protein [Providencia rettgeri]|nr:glycosyltransferase family 2 protein [Providencia rettgeri]MBX6969484.1 glycosyltransferase family 2 protein [Providencia rettgeri]MBX6976635.1 glycosyltransferase family 2 protein [Providencia rettgeri]MBX6995449.1 glycosyltransferase family 2 protein [Providencia rettgeri]MBX7022679.1 glycosyltransferase family 2 protein [Providencia rettgeri]